jgi:hypothetical protein
METTCKSTSQAVINPTFSPLSLSWISYPSVLTKHNATIHKFEILSYSFLNQFLNPFHINLLLDHFYYPSVENHFECMFD